VAWVSAEEAPGVAAPGADGPRTVRTLAPLALLAVTLVAHSAHAQSAETNLRVARQLFVEAEKDEDGNRWGEALEKLRRVAGVKHTAGVRYHVALCEEHLGQLAAALDEYTSAEGQAREENAQDVMRLVGKRIADLGPRVPRLTIRVSADAPGATVTLDGARLPPAVLGTAFPVDPGEHHVQASAPGHVAASQVVTLHERDVTSIDLRLPEEPSPAAPSAPTPATATATATPPEQPLSAASSPVSSEAPPPASHPARTGAFLATAGAVVLAGTGVAAYFLAGSARDAGRTSCARVVSTSPGACDSQKNGVRAWDFTAAGAWVGAAAVGAIAVVLWTRPAPASPSAQLLVGPRSIGLEGRF
jgi:hypothetical protein